MSFSDVRQQISTALATIDGLETSAYRPAPMLNTPCAFVVPNNIQYGFTIPRQNQKNYFDIQLLVGRQKDLSESQADLDEYMDYSGSKSIKWAVEHGTYTGISAIKVLAMTQYGGFMYDEIPYWGALFRVETY